MGIGIFEDAERQYGNAIVRCFGDRNDWLLARSTQIGGSDAGAIMGACPWKTNEELWEEKFGIVAPKDLSDNPLVEYGVNAEASLRHLFVLDYPQYTVFYHPFNIWVNDAYPFAHASLDGWLYDAENNRYGILEIKTATISSKAQKEKWAGTLIPQNYYCQLLHYFLVTEFDFAILKAQLKYEMEGEEPFLHTKHYRIERKDVIHDIIYLKNKEIEFWNQVKSGIRPNIQLPEI